MIDSASLGGVAGRRSGTIAGGRQVLTSTFRPVSRSRFLPATSLKLSLKTSPFGVCVGSAARPGPCRLFEGTFPSGPQQVRPSPLTAETWTASGMVDRASAAGHPSSRSILFRTSRRGFHRPRSHRARRRRRQPFPLHPVLARRGVDHMKDRVGQHGFLEGCEGFDHLMGRLLDERPCPVTRYRRPSYSKARWSGRACGTACQPPDTGSGRAFSRVDLPALV